MAKYIKTEDATPYLTKYVPSVEAIERSKIDKAITELEKEIKENHLNEIDHAGGEFILKDFVYGAITRFKNNIGEQNNDMD